MTVAGDPPCIALIVHSKEPEGWSRGRRRGEAAGGGVARRRGETAGGGVAGSRGGNKESRAALHTTYYYTGQLRSDRILIVAPRLFQDKLF